jgi:NAD dependent epimerase/dehydratase family enzyme
MSWIDLDDEVRAITFLLANDVRGPVNLTAPEAVTNAELAKALGRAVHRPAVVPVPAFGPRLLLGRELADSLLFVSQRVRPVALEQAGYEFAHPELAGALAHVIG